MSAFIFICRHFVTQDQNGVNHFFIRKYLFPVNICPSGKSKLKKGGSIMMTITTLVITTAIISTIGAVIVCFKH